MVEGLEFGRREAEPLRRECGRGICEDFAKDFSGVLLGGCGPAAAALPCGTGLAGLFGFPAMTLVSKNGMYPAILSLWVTFF